MPFGIDILEDEIKSWGCEILETLLLDRTTGENIIWSTDDYASMGEAYTFFKHITPELITGDKKNPIAGPEIFIKVYIAVLAVPSIPNLFIMKSPHQK